MAICFDVYYDPRILVIFFFAFSIFFNSAHLCSKHVLSFVYLCCVHSVLHVINYGIHIIYFVRTVSYVYFCWHTFWQERWQHCEYKSKNDTLLQLTIEMLMERQCWTMSCNAIWKLISICIDGKLCHIRPP